MTHKTIVINLVGASGSGKTTIAKELEKMSNKYNVIQSYTTREPREKNEWGHTFITNPVEVGYCNSKSPKDWTLIEYTDSGHNIEHTDLIAYFNSYNSGNHYFATDSQVKRGKVNLYTVDANGANQVKDFYKGNNTVEVVTMYIQTDEAVRAERLINRNDTEQRLEQDRGLFKVVECDYAVSGNESIEQVVEAIDKLIQNQILS